VARVLAISSQVAFGPVGNSAAVPALQAQGHEVLAVPTITLSNHPGHGAPAGFRTTPADLAAILDRLAGLGALASCTAVMTGYFAAAEQVTEAARAIAALKAATPSLLVLVDPVIGDAGSLYVPEAVAQAIGDRLVPLATVLTPNRFELEWLTGQSAASVPEAALAARGLHLAEVVATSIPAGPQHLATLAVTALRCDEWLSPLRSAVPHGTGDFLAGLYLAERLASPPAIALAAAMGVLERAIAGSAGSPVLDVAGSLHGP
jgi:pyridoxine kinase